MTKSLFLTVSALLIVHLTSVIAQTNKIEIFKATFYNAITPLQKADAALAISSQSHSLNNDTLYYYASVAKKIAVDLKDKEREIMADVFIEDYLVRKNLFDSALKICNADLKNLDYKHNKDAYSKIMMQKCFCLAKANRNTSALDFCYKFLAESEEYNDSASQIYTKCIIGIVYRDLQQTDLAMNWFLKANAITSNASYESIKNEFGVYFLLGMMYNWKFDGDNLQNEKLRDSVKAIYFLDRSIDDSRRYENLSILAKALNVKAATIGNRANVEEEGRYVKEADRIYSQLNDTSSMLNTISPMCFYYMDEGHPEKGIAACKEGIRIASLSNSYPVLDLYEALGQCYYAAGDYPKYAETLNSIIRIKDSLYKVNSTHDLAELNATYEDQKKENIIIRQKLDITSKKYSILLISIITGILLIGFFLLYRYYTRKQKKMKQEEIAAVSRAQEGERKRISADLHDNIGAYAAAAASTIGSINAKDNQSTLRLNLLKNNIQDMIAHLNDSIWALNKMEVLLTGVSDRFKIFVQKLEPSYPHISILIDEKIDNDHTLSSFQALHLFRIMQEALNNALRHSQCSCIKINIQSNPSQISINIEDNGTGMPSTKINGNGVANLKMRALELGWSAEWINNEIGGTSVLIHSGLISSTTNSALASQINKQNFV